MTHSEIETTRAEKLLAWVLAAFLLVGGIWVYIHLDRTHGYGYRPATASGADREALRRDERARARLGTAQRRERADVQELELRREAFRTALEAHQPSSELEAAYRRSEARLAADRAAVGRERSALAAVRPRAEAARSRLAAAERRAAATAEARQRHDARVTFAVRLLYVLLTLGAAYGLLAALRRRGSRYQVVALAAVGFAAVQALVMAGDYVTDYIDVSRSGLLVLSLAGIALTLAALAALQRYVAKRVPARRVRKRECPFCGFPVGDGPHCEGCGRGVVAACARCEAPRRVGTPHCAACGA